nr:hypothetical protein [uncultured Kingella sp.]
MGLTTTAFSGCLLHRQRLPQSTNPFSGCLCINKGSLKSINALK